MAAPETVAFEILSDLPGIPGTAAERLYGAPLRFPGRPRPYVIANFVTTIDGVVSLGLSDGTDSSTISAHSIADRFVMALLRVACDVVVIGAGTLRASVGHQWVPQVLAPAYTDLLVAYRESLARAGTTAPLAVVTASGLLPSHVALKEPATRVAVVTTRGGLPKVREAFPELQVIVAGEGERLSGDQVVRTLHKELKAGLILSEGGPALAATLQASASLHELFLTVSPRLAGRDSTHHRLALLEGFAAEPSRLPAASLLSVRRAEDHLLLRYRLKR
jgi:riboflavin biosynthesis pyrimidine reductase